MVLTKERVGILILNQRKYSYLEYIEKMLFFKEIHIFYKKVFWPITEAFLIFSRFPVSKLSYDFLSKNL